MTIFKYLYKKYRFREAHLPVPPRCHGWLDLSRGATLVAKYVVEKRKRKRSEAVQGLWRERSMRNSRCERPALPPGGVTSGPVQPPSAASGSETLLQLTFVDVRPVLPSKAIQILAVWTAA